MSPKCFSNITTVMTNKTKPLSIFLVQTELFCLLLLFQPLGNVGFKICHSLIDHSPGKQDSSNF